MLGYFWHAELADRDPGVLHIESPERSRVLSPENIFGADYQRFYCQFDAKDSSILNLVHEPEYLLFVKNAAKNGVRFLDHGDTPVTPDIYYHSLLGASAGCVASDQIMTGRFRNAFCAVRPPGHHANGIRALGFCVFNNIAIAARYSQKTHGFKKILIIDWDVHPGNGTSEIFWQDDSVFTLSFHQKGIFGSAGLATQIGAGQGEGFCRNVEMEPGVGGEEYLSIFEKVLESTLAFFPPEFILISAGFDSHARDLIGKMNLEAEHYRAMTCMIGSMGRSSKGIISILEGGYNVTALQESVVAHCQGLMS